MSAIIWLVWCLLKMKRFLTIIFVSLLFSGNAYALKLEKCFFTEHVNPDNVKDKFDNVAYENRYYEFNLKNNKAKSVWILTEKRIKEFTNMRIESDKRYYKEHGVDKKVDTSPTDKIESYSYKITFVDENYIVAIRDNSSSLQGNAGLVTVEKITKITVDLKNKSILQKFTTSINSENRIINVSKIQCS
jgi:hypothetical protein